MKINKIKLIYSYIDNPHADDYLYYKSEYERNIKIYNFYEDFKLYYLCYNNDEFMLPGFIYNFVNLHNTGKFKF